MTQFSEHFTFKEIACPCCQVIKLAPGFIFDLEEVRRVSRVRMDLTSCCRCEKHNTEVGGHERSLHLIDNEVHETDTCGVDIIRPKNAFYFGSLISALSELQWSIRIYREHIHADKRTKYTKLNLEKIFQMAY